MDAADIIQIMGLSDLTPEQMQRLVVWLIGQQIDSESLAMLAHADAGETVRRIAEMWDDRSFQAVHSRIMAARRHRRAIRLFIQSIAEEPAKA